MANKISTIVCCTENSEHFFPNDVFTYIDIPLFDDDMPLFNVITKKHIDLIDQKMSEGSVLIHCAAGVSKKRLFADHLFGK